MQQYTASFEITNIEEIVNYFDKYGYVVIDNVLSQEECHLSVDECWDYLTKRGDSFALNEKMNSRACE